MSQSEIDESEEKEHSLVSRDISSVAVGDWQKKREAQVLYPKGRRTLVAAIKRVANRRKMKVKEVYH